MSRIFAVALALLALAAPAPAPAGVVNGYLSVGPIASSFCTMTVAAATALSSCGSGIPGGAVCIMATVTGQPVNWRDDGSSPTATVGTGGQLIAVGERFWYCGKLSALLFIQQGATATFAASFYK